MSILGVDSVSNITPSDSQIGEAGGELGKNEFLQMLVAQMSNQDPMDPMDNSQMTAQLAQFSSLEQMENLNNKFESFQQSTATAMSLMNTGKEVEVVLADGSPVSGTLEKVQWVGGETQFVIDGVTYSMNNVESMSAAEEAEAESASESETTSETESA